MTLADRFLASAGTTTVTIKFSEPVSGFELSDLSATNGTLSNLASSDGGVTWTATLTASDILKAGAGRITLDLAGLHNGAGNAGDGKVYSSQYVVGPGHGNVTTVDGASVLTQEVKDATTGLTNQVTVVSEIGTGRLDDPGTPNRTLADIPLGVSAAPGSLTASLPIGTGLQVEGATVALEQRPALVDLVARIQDKTVSGSASQANMTGSAVEFLATLGNGGAIQTRTIVATVAPGTPSGQPIVIAGAAAQPGAPAVGLVIDGSGLPAGAALVLDNVDFAAVTGDVRLFGGAGRNYVVGDSGAQTIYLGAEDDILLGGGGNDFIGSAGGDDRLDGGDGADLVAGGIGNDTLFGGAGNDLLQGGRSTVGSWDFYVGANGAISARHSGALFTLSGSEQVQAAELDAATPELAFLQANAQQLVGISLLYAALGRAPDVGGLSYWSRTGITLQDVARGVLASAEWNGGLLAQAGDEAFVRGLYQAVLGRSPEDAGLAYWLARLAGSDGRPASGRADVLLSVALSDEHRAHAALADGYQVGQATLTGERGWFGGSGDDLLTGGAGSDLLVGGDGVDTALYAGRRDGYHILLGADGLGRVADAANGDVDTLSGIESAQFLDGTLDLGFLRAAPGQLETVGLLYQAVLDRPGDLAGLNWWLGTGGNAAQLALAFTQTAEFHARFDGMGDAAFVKALYDNSGLDAAAAGGMGAWQGYLANHTRAELIAQWIAQDSVVHAQFGTAGLWLV
jgi:Ca2+-binding RTX toxin-like protein